MRQRYPAGVVTLSSLLAMVACYVLRVFISNVSTRLGDIYWLNLSFEVSEAAYAFAPCSEDLSSSPVPSAESPAAVLDQLRSQEHNTQIIPSQKRAAKDYPDIALVRHHSLCSRLPRPDAHVHVTKYKPVRRLLNSESRCRHREAIRCTC